MPQIVIAKYIAYTTINVPKGVDLEDKEQVKEWWIKYNTLHIVYANGEMEEIEGYFGDTDYKYPEETEIEDGDDDDDDDDDETEGSDKESTNKGKCLECDCEIDDDDRLNLCQSCYDDKYIDCLCCCKSIGRDEEVWYFCWRITGGGEKGDYHDFCETCWENGKKEEFCDYAHEKVKNF